MALVGRPLERRVLVLHRVRGGGHSESDVAEGSGVCVRVGIDLLSGGDDRDGDKYIVRRGTTSPS